MGTPLKRSLREFCGSQPLTALLAIPLLGEPLHAAQAAQAASAALVLAGIYIVNRGSA
jgi:drug/metabolite transporter (DMT)-like permease